MNNFIYVFLFNTNNFQTDLFGTLENTTTPDQSESGSNGHEGVLHTLLSVMVLVMKNGIIDQSSNPDQGLLHFTSW